LVSITLAIAAGALALGAGSALGQFKAHRNAPDIPGSAAQGGQAVTVMVELADQPAAVVYAQSVAAAAARAGRSSFESMDPASRTAAAQAAVSLARAQVARVEAAQQAILPQINAASVQGRAIFRVKSAYNGISVYVPRSQIAALSRLPGVKAVHIQIPKYLTAATDIDFLNARISWTKISGNTPYGGHGENIRIADIDTGLDYIHTNFGGPGTPAAYASVTDTGPVPNLYFPTFKVPGGYDFAGDAYDGTNMPVPDANPLDSSNGHGTATASLIAGFGVNGDGATYTGLYDNATDIASMKISPGFAPKAQLYPLRVFGVTGGTNLVTQAIDWAIDPNGDGTISDHLDVISMSLGANNGDVNDPDVVAADNASAAGVIVASAAGNAGDSYYIVSSPSIASHSLSVAASFNDTGGFFFDSNVTVNSPGAIAGQKYLSLYGSPSPAVPMGGLTANVVYAIPPDGNGGITNGAAISGNFCLIDRGAISFALKVSECQAAGAVGVIVVQSAAGSGTPYPIVMALGSPTPSIPAVMIGLNDGATIKANLASGVNITLNNDNGFFNVASTAADTMAGYSARGPRRPDNMLKPDITAPAEVVGVAHSLTGTQVEGFNGTSSATPHISGIMALLRQLHPTWTVDELKALVMNTAVHDEFTGPGGTGSQYGTGRVGNGRVDVQAAVSSNVVAYNAVDAGLVSVSFGSVEVPVAGSTTLSKDITISNKGASSVTFNVSYQDVTPVNGATFTVGSGSPVTVPAGGTATVTVQFQGMGNLLTHVREASVPLNLPSARQWLTEKTGYAVFTGTTMGDPTLRVALYAAPKPVSSMHAPATFAAGAPVNSLMVPITGTGINTGASPPTDIVSLAKTFELQYTGSCGCNDPNVIRNVGVTSDYVNQGASTGNTVITFAIEGNATANTPDFNSSDKEVFFDVNGDGNADFVVFLSYVSNGTASSNAYRAALVNLSTNVVTTLPVQTNLLSPANFDTNSYNNSVVLFSVPASALGLAGAGQPTRFSYVVATFDRSGNLVDFTNELPYDLAKPGVETENGNLEPFYYTDVAPLSIPVNYNGVQLQLNSSLGMLTVHRHNGTGLATDVTQIVPPIGNVLWRHHDDVNYLWLMNVAAATPIALPPVIGANWMVAGIADVDGDGYKDIIWFEKTTGSLYVWLMNGTSVLSVVGLGQVSQGAGPNIWLPEAVGDFNGDGIPDILWRHQTLGAIYIWYGQPDGSYIVSNPLGALDPTKIRLAGVGDMDGNGSDDVAWSFDQQVGGIPAGTVLLWATGPGFSINAYTAGPNGSKRLQRVGDFDGDGIADMIWVDPATGATDVWYLNQGPWNVTGGVVSAMQAMPAMTVGFLPAASVDFNSDGKKDVLWFNQTTGAASQWLMMGRGNAPVQNSLGIIGNTWFVPNQ
jgi:subtilisin family serine protease